MAKKYNLKINKKDKIILDLCGGTGSWSRPYKEAGYSVILIDLLNGENVKLVKYYDDIDVYGILAAPDCTHLALSGARYWKEKGEVKLLESLSVVDSCLRIIFLYKLKNTLKFWCLENPVGRLIHYLGKPNFMFNPCDFGDPYTKKTCLWGEFNIPKTNYVIPIEKSKMYLKYGGKSLYTKKMRSITPNGFAESFFKANQ